MVAMNNNLTDKRQGSQYKKLIFFFLKKIHIVTWKRGGNLTSHPKMSKKCS
jgi:hypothetical protein